MAIPIPIIGDIVNVVGGILDKVIPDKDAREKAKHEIEMTLVSQDFQLKMGQIEINKEEAKHHSIFVAGARPFIVWVCGFALAWQFIGHPLLTWGVKIAGASITAPELNTDGLISVVMSLLGLGGLRTFEKIRGVQDRH